MQSNFNEQSYKSEQTWGLKCTCQELLEHDNEVFRFINVRRDFLPPVVLRRLWAWPQRLQRATVSSNHWSGTSWVLHTSNAHKNQVGNPGDSVPWNLIKLQRVHVLPVASQRESRDWACTIDRYHVTFGLPREHVSATLWVHDFQTELLKSASDSPHSLLLQALPTHYTSRSNFSTRWNRLKNTGRSEWTFAHLYGIYTM